MTPGPARFALGVSVLLGGALLLFRPEHAPPVVLAALLLAVVPLLRARRAARGTALGAAVVWGLVAVGLGIVAESLAATEPLSGGRPGAGHLTYLATLSALAGLISVLNARTPGGGAWAVLMALLILVFLIPWLEGAGLRPGAKGLARLRLDNPWTLFYGLLVLAGVTNYLPTRYGPAVCWLLLGFGLEFLGLTRAGRSAAERATVWTAVPWTLSAAVATADLRARSGPGPSGRLEAAWFWFRDHWGVVWALRVMERFNRSAEASGWSVRLAWHGVVAAEGGVPQVAVPPAALATLVGLLRRFATPERIASGESGGSRPLVKGRPVTDDGGGGKEP